MAAVVELFGPVFLLSFEILSLVGFVVLEARIGVSAFNYLAAAGEAGLDFLSGTASLAGLLS
jgi:hypothetical protein